MASSHDAIIGTTVDGTMISWNAAAVRLYGYTEAEMLGRSIALLTGPERQQEPTQLLVQLQHGEGIERFETQGLTSAKTISTYRLRLLKKLRLHTTAELIRYALQHLTQPGRFAGFFS